MLAENTETTSIYYAVDFHSRLGHGIGEVADRIIREWGDPSSVALSAHGFIQLCWQASLESFDLTPSRIAWQGTRCSLLKDSESREKHLSMIAEAARILNIETFKRVGIKIVSYLPLGMSHAEMCRLFFGSIVAPIDALSTALGQPKDPYVRLEGSFSRFDYVLGLSAMSEDQIRATVRSLPNSNQMIIDGFPDSAFSEYFCRVASQPSLYFDVDIYEQNVACNSFRQFFAEAIDAADKLAVGATSLLQFKPVKPS